MQKYEKGTNRISTSILTEITRVLHVDVGSFFDGLEAQNGKELVDVMTPEHLGVTREAASPNESFLQISGSRVGRKIR